MEVEIMFRLILILLLCFSLMGCQEKETPEKILSEEQAISLVKEKFGDVTIDHVTHGDNRYYIRYSNPSNCESGSIQIDDKTGEMLDCKASIC